MVSEAVYRFELAKTGRSGCRNTACKKANISIIKGELRMGTQVTIKEATTWHWKHWGCVTPKQIENLQSQIEGLDKDNDEDMEVIDGFDEVDEESREKIREALKVGHVADEDWKGEPELNRPGMKGINKRTPKKKAASEEPEDTPEEADSPVKKPKKSKKADAKVEADVADADVKPAKAAKKRKSDATTKTEEGPEPAPKKAKASKATVKQEDTEMEDVKPAKKATKSRAKKTAPVVEDATAGTGLVDGATDEAESAPPKKSKKSKVKAEAKTEGDDINMEDVAPPRRSGRKTRAKA